MDLNLTQLIFYGISAFPPLSKLANSKVRKRKKKKKMTLKKIMTAKKKKKNLPNYLPPKKEKEQIHSNHSPHGEKLSCLYCVHQNLESRESICYYSSQSNQSTTVSEFTRNFLINKFFQRKKQLLVSKISPVEVKIEHLSLHI